MVFDRAMYDEKVMTRTDFFFLFYSVTSQYNQITLMVKELDINMFGQHIFINQHSIVHSGDWWGVHMIDFDLRGPHIM